MIRLYRAYADNGQVIVEASLPVQDRVYDSGLDGYGEVIINTTVSKVNYSVDSFEGFIALVRNEVRRSKDGFIKPTVFNPMTYEELEGSNVKDVDEGILLFTDYVSLKYEPSDLVRHVAGRDYTTGIYALREGASFTMSIPHESRVEYEYEVLRASNGELTLYQLSRRRRR